jgi:predicted RNase H-like nuclease
VYDKSGLSQSQSLPSSTHQSLKALRQKYFVLQKISFTSMPQLVLGIDAAWTARHPSGVALVSVPQRGRPRLLRIARSYAEFCDLQLNGKIDWATKTRGTAPNIPALLAACQALAGQTPSVVALDIPLGPQPIIGRRASDKMVTSAYIRRKAGTHSPTAERPGPISRMLFGQLSACGFKWLHAKASTRHEKNTRLFIEAYPHPAIIELLGLNERLRYKVGKLKKYWPELDRAAQRKKVVQQLNRLRAALDDEILDVKKWLPAAASFLKNGPVSRLKGCEDALDAVVCAWIGCEFLAGRCVAYGDEESAIWLPRPRR